MWERQRGSKALACGTIVLALAGCTVKNGSDGLSARSSTTRVERVSNSTTTSRAESTTTLPAPTTTTVAPTTTLPPPATAGEALARVSLQPSQLAPTYSLVPYQDGDVVSGQVTLDLCGATFPSENRRRNRHQVGTTDAAGKHVGMSTEAVLYDSEAGAQQALAEVAAAKAQCPPGFVRSDVAGVPPLKFAFGPPPDAGWPTTPGVTRLGLAATVADQQGNRYPSVALFQQRGALLVGFYISDAGKAFAALAATAGGFKGVATAIARSLAALPASAVAGDFTA
jgi:hypothetical protein